MTDQERIEKLKYHYRETLELLGEHSSREGLLKTPERVAKAMLTLTRGYAMDPVAVLNSAKFKEEYNQMVIVKDIEFYSLCEHHCCLSLERLMWRIFLMDTFVGYQRFLASLIFSRIVFKCKND